MPKLIDLSGVAFGRWTVLSRAPDRKRKKVKAMWNCSCRCGTTRVVSGGLLRSGESQSCGCKKIEAVTRACAARAKMTVQEAFWRQREHFVRRSALSRNLDYSLTTEQLKAIMKLPCRYCGASPKFKPGRRSGGYGEFINGVDRVENFFGYVPSNCVPCCETCNRSKLQMSKSEFLAWVDRVHKHQHSHDDRSKNPISEKFWLELEAA